MSTTDELKANAERLQWHKIDTPVASEVITNVTERRLKQGFPPGWEDRYSSFMKDCWIYVYLSEYIICRFLLTKVEDGTYRIDDFQSSGQMGGNETNAIQQVLYSVRYHWDRLKPSQGLKETDSNGYVATCQFKSTSN